VELEGEPPFAVASIVFRRGKDGTAWARFASVGREPFEVQVLEPDLDLRTKFDGVLDRHELHTSAGSLVVRSLRSSDAEWLSAFPIEALPEECLEELVRVLHDVETSRVPGTAWAPYNEEEDGPVEYVHAHACRGTRSVYALSYGAGTSDDVFDAVDVLAWRAGSGWGDWSSQPPVDSNRWRSGLDEKRVLRTYPVDPGNTERFLGAFDEGQWISIEAAMFAAKPPHPALGVSDVSSRLVQRIGLPAQNAQSDVRVFALDEHWDAFAAGQAHLSSNYLLDRVLDVDAQMVPAMGGGVEDLEVVLVAWNMPGPRLAATFAVSLPLRSGGLVRVEAFPLPNPGGYYALKYGARWSEDRLGDVEVARQSLSDRVARTIAGRCMSFPSGFLTDDEGRPGFESNGALAMCLAAVLPLTIFAFTVGLGRGHYEGYCAAGREDMPTPEMWGDVLRRMEMDR
jgi:hypothetical protein